MWATPRMMVGESARAAMAATTGVSSLASCRSTSTPETSPVPVTVRPSRASDTSAPIASRMSRIASPACVVCCGHPGTVTRPPVTSAAARNGAALDRSGSTCPSTALISEGSTRQTSGSASSTMAPAYAGAIVDDAEPDVWRVEPSEINAVDGQVEPDLSNAAPFLAAALVTGGRVTVPGWPQHTTQAGDAIRDILDAMGADVSLAREGLTVTGTGEVSGVDVDLHDASELTPVVAAIAARADSPTIIRGVAHIRGHETDRLAALARELGALGTEVAGTHAGLRIRPRPMTGRLFRTYADHRLAMAAAVLGLRVPGLVVEDVATVGKTLPDFVGLWQSMVGQSRPASPTSPASPASRATGFASA